MLNINYAVSGGNVYLKTNKEQVEKESELEITLCIENSKTAAYTSYLYFDDSKLEYVSGPENTNVVGNKIIHIWYDTQGGKNLKEGELDTFKFKAKENGVATFNIQGDFYDNDGKAIETEFKELQVQIGNDIETLSNETEETNTNLEILAIENVLLNPPFDASITQYNVEVSNETNDLNIFAVPENENAKVEISDKDELKEGSNLIKVTVTAQNGFSTKVYEVNVYKRNQEEEAKYLKEQEANREQLEEIYNTEKTSNEQNEVKNIVKKPITWVIVVVIVIAIAGIVAWRYKKKNQ